METMNTSFETIDNNFIIKNNTINDMFHPCFSVEIFEEYINKYWSHLIQTEKEMYISLKKALTYDDFSYISEYNVMKYLELQWYDDIYIMECKQYKCWNVLTEILEKSIQHGIPFNMYNFVISFTFLELTEYIKYTINYYRADLLSTILTIIYNYLKLQSTLENFYKLMDVIDIIWNNDRELYLYKIYVIEERNVVIISPNLIINGINYNTIAYHVIYI